MFAIPGIGGGGGYYGYPIIPWVILLLMLANPGIGGGGIAPTFVALLGIGGGAICWFIPEFSGIILEALALS
jgi:hypothetical protein